MVIDNFHTMSAVLLPNKAQPPLIVNTDAVLSLTLTFQCFQSVPWRHSQAVQFSGSMQLEQFSPRNPFDVLESAHALAMK